MQTQLLRLEQRRYAEKSAIQERDRTSIQEGEHWYLLSVNWLKSWHEFIQGSTCVPGPITNSELLAADGSKPREGLVRAKHYRGVTKEVWQYFYETYGGGPELVCESHINIYDAKLQINKK